MDCTGQNNLPTNFIFNGDIMVEFTKNDIKHIKQANSHYDNDEIEKCIKALKQVAFFKNDINWFIGLIIEDMDRNNKGFSSNRAKEYLSQALDYTKEHFKEQNDEKTKI